MAKQISLTQGYSAIVDDEDYEWLSQHKWAVKDSRGKRYATRALGSRGKQITIWMHRLIMNCPGGMEIDHINGDSLDNRRDNLRIVTRAQNLRNRKTFKNSKSGFKGVVYNPINGKWKVIINFGTYDTAEEAAKAYVKAIEKLFGVAAKLNISE